MNPELKVPQGLWASIEAHLLGDPELERAAVGFAGVTDHGRSYLLRDWKPVEQHEYLAQLSYHLEVSPVVWARASKRSRKTGEALIILHSHPGDFHEPSFSGSDDAGESRLVPKMQQRADVPIGALVVSPGGVNGRLHTPGGSSHTLHVSLTERQSTSSTDPTSTSSPDSASTDRFARQVLALGARGQKLLSSLTVGIVGAGGLGSHVIQQLAHLGVGRILVTDFDRVDQSNLSRLIGAHPWDARFRRSKASIARRTIRHIGGPSKCEVLNGRIQDESVAIRFRECDFVFGCTDNQSSRVILNALAFQYYVPTIDLGVELQASGAMGGRVSYLQPGEPCLWCTGVLSDKRVRAEQLPVDALAHEIERGYVQGLDSPAPAVVSINGVVASLGVTEFLAHVTQFTADRRCPLLLYRVNDGSVRRTKPLKDPGCYTCSSQGILGAGDLAPEPWSPLRAG